MLAKLTKVRLHSFLFLPLKHLPNTNQTFLVRRKTPNEFEVEIVERTVTSKRSKFFYRHRQSAALQRTLPY